MSSHLIPKLPQFQASSVIQVKLLGYNFHKATERPFSFFSFLFLPFLLFFLQAGLSSFLS